MTLTAYRFRGLITFISDECEPELMCLFTANDYDGEVAYVMKATFAGLVKIKY